LQFLIAAPSPTLRPVRPCVCGYEILYANPRTGRVPAPLAISPTLGSPPWRPWVVLAVVLIVAGFVGWRILLGASKETIGRGAEVRLLRQPSRSRARRRGPVSARCPSTSPRWARSEAYNTVTVRSRRIGSWSKVKLQRGPDGQARRVCCSQIDAEPYAARPRTGQQGQLARDQASAHHGQARGGALSGSLPGGRPYSQESQQTQQSIYGQGRGRGKADEAAIHRQGESGIHQYHLHPSTVRWVCARWTPGNIGPTRQTPTAGGVTQLQPISVIFTVPEDQLPQVRKKLLSGKPMRWMPTIAR